MDYKYYFESSDSSSSEYETITISDVLYRKCRGCGKDFIPEDISGTNARSYRCNDCFTLKSLAKDIVYNCIIS
tara:strand:- start:2568 stop:2786 length:219 start_codon:yes stop_codon:yes gene_type:complete